MKSKRHHTLIAGTGRAGTTFLVELLTRLGLDTGFTAESMTIDKRAFAGLERDIRKPTAPYIAKDPAASKYLRRLLARGNVVIDHAIVPVRDFEAAAKSRARVSSLARAKGRAHASGGLWLTNDPEEQIAVLYEQFALLMETLSRHDIPTTLLWFPRLANDAQYTYEKLRFLMPSVSFDRFSAEFTATARPERVHQLSDADA